MQYKENPSILILHTLFLSIVENSPIEVIYSYFWVFIGHRNWLVGTGVISYVRFLLEFMFMFIKGLSQ